MQHAALCHAERSQAAGVSWLEMLIIDMMIRTPYSNRLATLSVPVSKPEQFLEFLDDGGWRMEDGG